MKLHSVYGQLLFDRKLTAIFKEVKANKGAGGIDGETIGSYESNLKGNVFDLLGRLQNKEYNAEKHNGFKPLQNILYSRYDVHC